MKVVILAGGLGTRLGEETELRPKVMVTIGDKPIIWHIMKIYAAAGFCDIVLCLGYKGYIIKEFFANYFLHMSDVTFNLGQNTMEVHRRTAEDWRVTLVKTGAAAMTGGRLRNVRSFLPADEPFCMTYGDGVADIDICKVVNYHREHGRLATLPAVGLRAGAIPPIRNPTAVRPWQHVLDALGGYLHLVRKLYEDDSGQATFARGWNFGPCTNDERPVHAVADAVCRRWSPHAKWQTVRDHARHEAHSLKLDTSRTTQLLGWKPVWSFEETMNATIRWYRKHAEGADMADFTTGQIIGHLSRATQRKGSLS